MIEVTHLGDKHTSGSNEIKPGSWLHVIDPTDDDLTRLSAIGIPSEFLVHVTDLKERSRVVQRDGVVHLVIHFPHRQNQPAKVPYVTVPVSIFVLDQFIVTVEPNSIGLQEKLGSNSPTGMEPSRIGHFILNLLLSAAAEYLTSLQEINEGVEESEHRLERSLRNREVLQLLNYQKSLVHFATSLNLMEVMFDKLRKSEHLHWADPDHALAEDVLIEIRQAIYQVEIAENILTQMMDAFASIVSNNLNTVMKFLAAITIVISVPMLIFSLYGMNVVLPGAAQSSAFIFVIVLSGILSLLVIVIFRRVDWL